MAGRLFSTCCATTSWAVHLTAVAEPPNFSEEPHQDDRSNIAMEIVSGPADNHNSQYMIVYLVTQLLEYFGGPPAVETNSSHATREGEKESEREQDLCFLCLDDENLLTPKNTATFKPCNHKVHVKCYHNLWSRAPRTGVFLSCPYCREDIHQTVNGENNIIAMDPKQLKDSDYSHVALDVRPLNYVAGDVIHQEHFNSGYEHGNTIEFRYGNFAVNHYNSLLPVANGSCLHLTMRCNVLCFYCTRPRLWSDRHIKGICFIGILIFFGLFTLIPMLVLKPHK